MEELLFSCYYNEYCVKLFGFCLFFSFYYLARVVKFLKGETDVFDRSSGFFVVLSLS